MNLDELNDRVAKIKKKLGLPAHAVGEPIVVDPSNMYPSFETQQGMLLLWNSKPEEIQREILKLVVKKTEESKRDYPKRPIQFPWIIERHLAIRLKGEWETWVTVNLSLLIQAAYYEICQCAEPHCETAPIQLKIKELFKLPTLDKLPELDPPEVCRKKDKMMTLTETDNEEEFSGVYGVSPNQFSGKPLLNLPPNSVVDMIVKKLTEEWDRGEGRAAFIKTLKMMREENQKNSDHPRPGLQTLVKASVLMDKDVQAAKEAHQQGKPIPTPSQDFMETVANMGTTGCLLIAIDDKPQCECGADGCEVVEFEKYVKEKFAPLIALVEKES